jgi:hypothetical protein
VPLSAGQVTLDSMLRHAGHSRTLARNTHVMPDLNGLARLHLNGTDLADVLRRGSFDGIDRYDGHHAPRAESGYAAFLRSQGHALAS